MAKVSFVDDLAKKAPNTEPKKTKKPVKAEVETKASETTDTPAKTMGEGKQKISDKTAVTQAARRTGRRGNR